MVPSSSYFTVKVSVNNHCHLSYSTHLSLRESPCSIIIIIMLLIIIIVTTNRLGIVICSFFFIIVNNVNDNINNN